MRDALQRRRPALLMKPRLSSSNNTPLKKAPGIFNDLALSIDTFRDKERLGLGSDDTIFNVDHSQADTNLTPIFGSQPHCQIDASKFSESLEDKGALGREVRDPIGKPGTIEMDNNG